MTVIAAVFILRKAAVNMIYCVVNGMIFMVLILKTVQVNCLQKLIIEVILTAA
ncbi:MAG: hypothetical protein FWG90_10790 [Oscillospiraceae bacterium]|nr:hypothetical protein [Oscillospiraceae bacterium]